MADRSEWDYVIQCDQKARRLGLEQVSEEERVVALLARLNFELVMGGLYVYLINTAGDEVVMTVWALRKVGAERAAELLESVVKCFPDQRRIHEQEYRHRYVDRIKRRIDKVSEALEGPEASVEEALRRYAAMQAEESFRRSDP